jgi:DNA-binding response OmpR family regulator
MDSQMPNIGKTVSKWLQKLWPSKKTDLSPIKVLIIEDNRVDAALIKKAVEVCGFNSLIARDGKTGFEMALRYKPDLIILDYHLPDTNGGQVLKNLRSNKETASETVMVLSALSQPGIVMDSFTNGADQYFTKPISVSLLAHQIHYMLAHPHTN